MTKKALAKNRVLLVYLVKSILSKGKDFVESAKADMLPAEDPETAETIKIEQDGLEVCFTPKKSPKKFNKEKAEAYLKETLGAQKYSQNFAHFKIEQKAGEPPPKELLDQMRKYFTISKVEDVTEDAVKRLPLGIPQEDIEENCYDRAGKYFQMTTPSKISDEELVTRFQEKNIPLLEVLEVKK